MLHLHNDGNYMYTVDIFVGIKGDNACPLPDTIAGTCYKKIIYHHYSACEEEMALHLGDGYRIIHHVSLIVCLEFKARLHVQVH